MSVHRDEWIKFYSAALTGVLQGRATLQEEVAAKVAAKVADQAMRQLLQRDESADYQVFFSGQAAAGQKFPST